MPHNILSLVCQDDWSCEEVWPAQPVLSNEEERVELVCVGVTGFLRGALVFIVLVFLIVVLRKNRKWSQNRKFYILQHMKGRTDEKSPAHKVIYHYLYKNVLSNKTGYCLCWTGDEHRGQSAFTRVSMNT